jgi:hypothetical protein
MNESWQTFPDAPEYMVSSKGRVAKVLKGNKVRNGYTVYNLPNSKGRRIGMNANHAVALTFHGKPPRPGMDASPQDGNRQNLSPDNIRWQSR